MDEERETYNTATYLLYEGHYTLEELKDLVRQIEEHEKRTRKALEQAMEKPK